MQVKHLYMQNKMKKKVYMELQYGLSTNTKIYVEQINDNKHNV